MENFCSILHDFMREHICERGDYNNIYFDTLANGEWIKDSIENLCKQHNLDYGLNWERTPCGNYYALVVDWMTPEGNDNIIYFVKRGAVER